MLLLTVLHHFCTKSRRVRALREMSRTLRPGGRIMVYVWAMEQTRRRFNKQDIFIPWHPSAPRGVSTGDAHVRGSSSSSVGDLGVKRSSGRDLRMGIRSDSCCIDDRSSSSRLYTALEKTFASLFFSRSLDEPLSRSANHHPGSSGSASRPSAEPTRHRSLEHNNCLRGMDVSVGDRTGFLPARRALGSHEEASRFVEVLASTSRSKVCLPDLVEAPGRSCALAGRGMTQVTKKPLESHSAALRLSLKEGDSGSHVRNDWLRYYHVFREGELAQMIERHVAGLRVVCTYYDHANWCVIAQKEGGDDT
uniref:Methyltransferase type 11 domain-containing protein n=1 Tax=Petromyzon marinus TaxID=7757 RepID=S4RTY6_PETMA